MSSVVNKGSLVTASGTMVARILPAATISRSRARIFFYRLGRSEFHTKSSISFNYTSVIMRNVKIVVLLELSTNTLISSVLTLKTKWNSIIIR